VEFRVDLPEILNYLQEMSDWGCVHPIPVVPRIGIKGSCNPLEVPCKDKYENVLDLEKERVLSGVVRQPLKMERRRRKSTRCKVLMDAKLHKAEPSTYTFRKKQPRKAGSKRNLDTRCYY